MYNIAGWNTIDRIVIYSAVNEHKPILVIWNICVRQDVRKTQLFWQIMNKVFVNL